MYEACLLFLPSQVKHIGAVLDAVALWLSTSNGFIAWAILAARPPLFLALPAQVFVLLRITAGNFCRAPVSGRVAVTSARQQRQAASWCLACCS